MKTEKGNEYKTKLQELNRYTLCAIEKEIKRYEQMLDFLHTKISEANMEIYNLTKAAEMEKDSIPNFDEKLYAQYKKYFMLEQKLSDLKESINKLIDDKHKYEERIMEKTEKCREIKTKIKELEEKQRRKL